MQYFIDYSGFRYEPAFAPSLFVDLRKCFATDRINEINETIIGWVNEEGKDKKGDRPSHNNVPDIESSELKPGQSIKDITIESIDNSAQETV